jgi:hypothetical protein
VLKLSKVNSIIVLLGLAVLSFITVKATISSFTHVESFSYLHYVHTSFMDIISFRDYYTNNHILNSLGMKYSQMLFGTSEFALRLPNLIMFAVYMAYCFLFFRKQNAWVLIGMFVILSTNTYLIDLFGLARGYGLSIGFMTMSLFHFIQSFYSQKTKNIYLFHIASLLAILSSFVQLDVYIALLIIYNLIVFIDSKIFSSQKYNFWALNKIHVIPFAIIAIVLYEPIRKVIMYSKLDFGGKTGFYEDTATYLVNYSLNNLPISDAGVLIIKGVFTFIVIGTSLIISQKLLKKDKDFWNENKAMIVLNLLIVLISIALKLQNALLNTDFPIARFSIFMVPIMVLQIGFLLSFLADHYYKSVAITISSLAIFLSFSFVSKANLHSCFEWEYDMETKNMMRKLSEYHSSYNSQIAKASIGISWIFEPTINFYRQKNNIDWLMPANRYGLSSSNDYFYCFKDELDQFSSVQYSIIAEFPEINTVLVKNHLTKMP